MVSTEISKGNCSTAAKAVAALANGIWQNGRFSNRTLLLCHIQVCSLALNDQLTSRRETWQCNFSACSNIGRGTFGSPITTDLFARKIPAFSKLISSRVEPRKSV